MVAWTAGSKADCSELSLVAMMVDSKAVSSVERMVDAWDEC